MAGTYQQVYTAVFSPHLYHVLLYCKEMCLVFHIYDTIRSTSTVVVVELPVSNIRILVFWLTTSLCGVGLVCHTYMRRVLRVSDAPFS